MFRNLVLKPVYTTDDNDIPNEFYIPTLKYAVKFDRTSAYFSARALAMYSEGLEYLCSKGGHYRMIISHDVSPEDLREIKSGYAIKKSVNEEMLEKLREKLSLREEMLISNLAYYIAAGTVDIKIAFKIPGIFHDKCGLMTDEEGNVICFRGSNNETEAAVDLNYESFQLTCSWLDKDGFYAEGIKKSQDEFEKLWNNKKDGLVVVPAEDVIIKEIIKHNKGKVIVEEILLKENSVILDYLDEQLVLQVNTDNLDWLTSKIFFKSRLQHKINRIEKNTIYFNPELVYPDYIKINELLEKKIPPLGLEYHATERLKEYIKQRNLYIEKRAKLGIELKTDAVRLEDRYVQFKEIVDSQFERTLRDKQMQDAFFMCAMMRSGNFSVPGSGKTSSALAVFSFLKYKDLVDRVVMIGPKNAFGSWIDEFKACFGDKLQLNCFNIQDSKYANSEARRQALKYDSGSCNLFLFNYESISNYVNELENLVSKRTLLVFDEVHKVKAIRGQRASVALDISKYAAYTIAMTGTPIPNSYLDLYNLLHILYNDEYKEYFGFDISYLRDPFPTDMEIINDKIQPFFCRTTKKELQVPEANPDIIQQIYTTENEKRVFDIVRKKYRNNKLALFIRILQLESNPKMLLEAIDLKDFSSVLDIDGEIDEIDFVDYAIEIQQLINEIEMTSKKKECLKLASQLVSEGKKAVIWCIFIDSIRSLQRELDSLGIKAKCIYGEVDLQDRLDLINDFKNGKYDILVTNPHTLAESVSLHSVCHDAIYFEYSYNLVHLLQSKDRIHRLGLPEGQYTQYYYMQDFFKTDLNDEYSLDEQVYLRLMYKEEVMLKAIDNNELEPVYTPEEDLELIFKGLFD